MRAKRFFVVLAIGLFLLGLVAVRERREARTNTTTPVATPTQSGVRAQITASATPTNWVTGPGDYENVVMFGDVERRYRELIQFVAV